MTDDEAPFCSSHLFTNNEASVALEVVTPSQLCFHVMPSKSDVCPTVNGISPADPTVCVQSICLLVRQNISALTCEETCTLLGSPFVCFHLYIVYSFLAVAMHVHSCLNDKVQKHNNFKIARRFA